MSFIVCENAWPPADGQPFKKRTQKKKVHRAESDLSSAIIDRLNTSFPRIICQKSHGTVYGKPTLDILGCNDGRFFWLEVKQPGEEPTKRQYKTMRDWIKKGAVASWTDSVEGAISFACKDWTKLTEKEMLEGFHGKS